MLDVPHFATTKRRQATWITSKPTYTYAQTKLFSGKLIRSLSQTLSFALRTCKLYRFPLTYNFRHSSEISNRLFFHIIWKFLIWFIFYFYLIITKSAWTWLGKFNVLLIIKSLFSDNLWQRWHFEYLIFFFASWCFWFYF